MSFCEFYSDTKNRSDVEDHVAHGIYELLHFKHHSWYMYIRKILKKNQKTHLKLPSESSLERN